MLVIRNIIEGQDLISLNLKDSALKCKKVIVNPFMEEYLKLDIPNKIVYVNSFAKLSSLSDKIGLTFSLEKNVSAEKNYLSLIGLDPQITSSTIWDNYSNSLEEYEYYWITNGTDDLRTSPGNVLACNGDPQDPDYPFIWMNSAHLDVSKVAKGTARRFRIYSLIPILYHYYSKLNPKTIEEICLLLLNTLSLLGSPTSDAPVMISKFIGESATTFVDTLIGKLFGIDPQAENCASLLSQRIHNATTITPPTARLFVEEDKKEEKFILYLTLTPNEDNDSMEYYIGDFKYPDEYEEVRWTGYDKPIPLNDYYEGGLFTKQILIRSSRSNEEPLFIGKVLNSSILAIPAGKENILFGDKLKVNKSSIEDSLTLNKIKGDQGSELICNPSL